MQAQTGHDRLVIGSIARSSAEPARWRRVGGYGAALAVTPYLLIKIAWTFGFLVPTAQMDTPEWRAVNAITAVLAAVGILLALAFSRPWGERLPAWMVILPVWVGTGLLVPLLMLAPVLGPAAMARDQAAGAEDSWIWEQVLVMVSLVGIGVGLPVALAGYVRARWPEALGGTLDRDDAAGGTAGLQLTLARLVAASAVALGVVKLYWAAGGTLGLDPDRLGDRDLWWHMLSLSTGAWALAGAWGALTLTSRRGASRFLPPMAAAWVASGMLFAYGLYSRLSEIVTDTMPQPEYPLARVLATEAGIVLGVTMLLTILMAHHDRRRAAELAGRPLPG